MRVCLKSASIPIAWVIFSPPALFGAEADSKALSVTDVPREIQTRLAAAFGIKGGKEIFYFFIPFFFFFFFFFFFLFFMFD